VLKYLRSWQCFGNSNFIHTLYTVAEKCDDGILMNTSCLDACHIQSKPVDMVKQITVSES